MMDPDITVPEHECMGARRAALAIALSNPRSPLPYETHTDKELLQSIQKCVPDVSPAECLEALATVRGLCNAVYDVCNEYRAGRFGTAGTPAQARAVNALSHTSPGFSRREYEEIFAAGLLWTAY